MKIYFLVDIKIDHGDILFSSYSFIFIDKLYSMDMDEYNGNFSSFYF
jgi:hypothetical protein